MEPSASSSHPNTPIQARSSRGIFVLATSVVLLITIGAISYRLWNGPPSQTAATLNWQIPAEFDADRAMAYLEKIVAFGPRPSGSPAMLQQQAFLEDFFRKQGATVSWQSFQARHPETGQSVELRNLIASYRPNAPKRYLLCAHYDTRPYPDQDPANPQGVFVGANDGGSGTAALMEFTHHITQIPENIGVDLVLFDGEELVYDGQRDPYFLGSTHFAQTYVADQKSGQRQVPYVAGVLLDMVADADLQLYYERNSWNYARSVTTEIWATAKRLGITAFQARTRHVLRDDHLPLNQIAKIPTTDIIDFDYPRPGFRHQSYWHTTEDTVDKCSGESIVAVLYVVHTWLCNRG